MQYQHMISYQPLYRYNVLMYVHGCDWKKN